MKTGIRVVFLAVGIVLVLAVFLVLGLHVFADTESAHRLVLSRINESIPGSVSWRDLHVSLLGGRIEMRSGVLAHPRGDELVAFEHAMVDLSWHTLLKGELTIEKAEFTRPRVYLGADPDDTLAIVNAVYRGQAEQSPGEKDEPFPLNIVVDKLVVSDGTITWENSDASARAEASGIDLSAQGDLFAEALDFTIRAGQVRYSGGEIRAVLQEFFADTELKEKTFDPIVVRAETGVSRMDLSGSVRNLWDKPYFTLAAEASVSLSELKDALGLSQELTGQANVRIEARGTLASPGIRADLTYQGGSLGGQRVDSAELVLSLKDNVMVLEHARASVASGDITAEGQADLNKALPGGIFSGQRDLNAISYTATVHGKGIDLAELFPAAGPVKGVASSSIVLSGTGISPDSLSARVSAELACKGLSFGTAVHPMDVTLATSAGIEKGVVLVESLDARSGSSTLAATGRIDLATRQVDARLELEVPELGEHIRQFGIEGNGEAGLVARISRTLDAPQIEVDLKGKGLDYEGVTIGNVACSAMLDQSGLLKVSSLGLENSGSKIEGSGSVRLYRKPLEFTADGPVDFTATLTRVGLKDFFPASDIAGTWTGKLSVGGTVDSPDALLSLEGAGLMVNDIRIGDIRVSSRYDDGTVTAEEVVVRNANSYLHATGTVKIYDSDASRFLSDPEIDLAIKASPVFLQDVTDEYTGTISLTGSVSGSVRKPKGEVSLSGEQLDFVFQKVDNAKVTATIDGPKAVLDMLEIVLAKGETIKGTGWVSLDKEYAFDLAARKISLRTIEALHGLKDIQGRIDLAVSGQGTFENPGLRGEGLITGVVMNRKKLDDFTIGFDLRDHRARAQLDMGFAFNASYDLGTHEFAASAAFDNTDLRPYFQIARQADLGGLVSGRIEAGGNMRSPDRIRADMDLSRLDISFEGEEIVRADDLRASVAGGVISIPGARVVVARRGWVDIKGTAALHGALSLTATGDIPMIAIAPFADGLEDIEGHVLISAQAGGTQADPDVEVNIDLKGIGFSVPVVEERLHDTSGRITVTQQEVLFEKVTGRFGEGSFDLAGKLELEDLAPTGIGLGLKARSVPVRIPDTLDLYADLDVVLKGTPDKSLMQGKAVLVEGVYYRDVKLSLIEGLRSVVERKPRPQSAPRKFTQPFLRNMGLDISVRRRNPLYVDNNLSQLDINPDLTITGTLNNPIINGRAGIESGTVEFRNRVFTVTRGVVDFLNPYRTEATIDLEAEVEVRDWKIYLVISGTPDALNLSLRSDPQEEDSDILSLLVLGKPSRELAAGEAAASQTTSAMIAALVASKYGEEFKEAAGLDILEIESETDEEDSAETVKVTIGKELSRRMTLKYAMESKNSELSQRAIAEYKLLENILVNGFQDTRGTFGADVLFRLEFR